METPPRIGRTSAYRERRMYRSREPAARAEYRNYPGECRISFAAWMRSLPDCTAPQKAHLLTNCHPVAQPVQFRLHTEKLKLDKHSVRQLTDKSKRANLDNLCCKQGPRHSDQRRH